jgi:hypothetical protein
VVGINLFQDFDCAYCLTGYYVSEDVVNTVLQDVLASDGHIPIKIETGGMPRRRRAGVVDSSHRLYDIERLAQLALEQQEMDVVLQAVGRVRPYTRPREVITFQCAVHPQLTYTLEFHNIGEARKFFGVPSRRNQSQLHNIERIKVSKGKGLTQLETAEKNGLSIRTVKRYWNSREVP